MTAPFFFQEKRNSSEPRLEKQSYGVKGILLKVYFLVSREAYIDPWVAKVFNCFTTLSRSSVPRAASSTKKISRYSILPFSLSQQKLAGKILRKVSASVFRFAVLSFISCAIS